MNDLLKSPFAWIAGGIILLIVIIALSRSKTTQSAQPDYSGYQANIESANQNALAAAQIENEGERDKLSFGLDTLRATLENTFSLNRLKADENVTLSRLASEEKQFFEASKTSRIVSLAGIGAQERTSLANINASSEADKRASLLRGTELDYTREVELQRIGSSERQSTLLFNSERDIAYRQSDVETRRIESEERATSSAVDASIRLEEIRGSNQVSAIRAQKKGETKKAVVSGIFGTVGSLLKFL